MPSSRSAPDDPYAYGGDQLRGYDDGGRGYADGPGDHDGYDRPPPRRRRRRRRWPLVLTVILLLPIVLLGAGYFWLDSRLERTSVLEDYAGRVAETKGTTWLIVGSDSREGLTREQRRKLATGRAEGRRTDSMMLLHYGSSGTTLVSLPRDLYVPIPGRGSNKLNAAFAFGGPKLLVRTVEQFTKLRIDHYAEVGFGGFVGVVDAMGGVDICVKKKMRDPKAGLNLEPGCQTLDGGQALGFVRTRATARADLDRINNQRQFFGALMKKATSPGVMFNPFRAVPLATNATSNFTVDDGDHLHHLVRMMWAMRDVSGSDGVTTSVPVGGSGSAAGVGAYITHDRAKSAQLFGALAQEQPVPRDAVSD